MVIPPCRQEVVRLGGPPQSIDGLKSLLRDFGMLDGADFIALANGLAGLNLNPTRFHRFR
jgi:hypothetical protein